MTSPGASGKPRASTRGRTLLGRGAVLVSLVSTLSVPASAAEAPKLLSGNAQIVERGTGAGPAPAFGRGSAAPAAAAAPAPTRVPPSPGTIPLPPPPRLKGERDAGGRNAIFAGGGWVTQSEWNAFDGFRASDVVLSYRRDFPATKLAAVATWEGRFGMRRIRLVDDPPNARPDGVREVRHSVGLSGTWSHDLFRRGTTAVKGSVGLGYRLEVHDNEVAPFVAGLAGPLVSMEGRRGSARVIVALESGIPLHDSSPDSLDAGPIEGRLGWVAELRHEVAPEVELVLGYRGEAMDRQYARSSAGGFAAGVSVGF